MKMVTDVQIDLYGEMQYYMASAKQGDKATRYLRIQLMNNGNEFQIPEDIILIANIKKPDGKFCYNECEREGNRVMVQLTNQALAAAGTAYCDIEMRSSNWELILSSAAFTIEIEPSMRNESAIESSNEMTFLEKKVQHYIDRMIQTENQVLTTENAVKIAEHARCLAEQGRVDAEDIRVENENARILGEKGRDKCGYYIGSGSPGKLKEYIITIRNTINPEKELKLGAVPYHGVSADIESFSIEKIKNDTGFEPGVKFEEGIVRTAEWLRKM